MNLRNSPQVELESRDDFDELSIRGRIKIAVAVALIPILIAAIILLMERGYQQTEALPDFTQYQHPAELKTAFFAYLEPMVQGQNKLILQEREKLKLIQNKFDQDGDLNASEQAQLLGLAAKYYVSVDDINYANLLAELNLRIDIVPVPLALVQAAKESAWGKSRFVRQANNLFGQWCFEKGCGIEPLEKASGSRHEVKRFESIRDSVRSYMHNLNTHESYAEFRGIRNLLRKNKQPMDSHALADGLIFYSEQRQLYVDEIKLMLNQYRSSQSPQV